MQTVDGLKAKMVKEDQKRKAAIKAAESDFAERLVTMLAGVAVFGTSKGAAAKVHNLTLYSICNCCCSQCSC